MDEQRLIIIDAAVRLAAELPPGSIHALARAIEHAAGPRDAARAAALQAIPQPAQRARASDFLDAWAQQAPAISGARVALALLSAAAATRSARAEQRVELIWTGPLAAGVSMRRTDQALLQVIRSAHRELLIVSFAVYKIPAVIEALMSAAARGVVIRICIEAPEPSGQKMAYDTIRALGPAVASAAQIYIWPSDRRPTDESGHTGTLHAKCAVADRRTLFLSSANLTDYALSLNMELGVLISGGPEPATVAAQFERMIAEGTLQKTQ
ncbi:DISARM system phospholipase D-like protein DrmC [Oscillochloris sp. ZM17-4]|uniref:DISARM system phospholipase D-like protein DrmC n=1 Tax=Oscillochloris sp. ZM17-4 TaxID=2866714 RepID=UPI001C735FA0|nr:DISARM system phospholipase D-like protein DrmC [Oscillochloris sp. ZM17-4]MBX0330821.1 DISARM system phospholipase D-like protein DrmC [Oscillochloris sp. ZM17-4]